MALPAIEVGRIVFGLSFETAAEAQVAVRRTTGRVIAANRRMAELTGADPADLVGARVDDLVTWSALGGLFEAPGTAPGVVHGAGGEVPVRLTVLHVAHRAAGRLAACQAWPLSDGERRREERARRRAAVDELAAAADRMPGPDQLARQSRELAETAAAAARVARATELGEVCGSLGGRLAQPAAALASTLARIDRLAAGVAEPALAAELEALIARGARAARRVGAWATALARAGAAELDLAPRWVDLGREIDRALRLVAADAGAGAFACDDARGAYGFVAPAAFHHVLAVVAGGAAGGGGHIAVARREADWAVIVDGERPGTRDPVAEAGARLVAQRWGGELAIGARGAEIIVPAMIAV